jgi:hypothetical protein
MPSHNEDRVGLGRCLGTMDWVNFGLGRFLYFCNAKRGWDCLIVLHFYMIGALAKGCKCSGYMLIQ